jgi:hypothetical protein
MISHKTTSESTSQTTARPELSWYTTTPFLSYGAAVASAEFALSPSLFTAPTT